MIYDFTEGRELNPRLAGIDLKKLLFSQVTITTWIAINVLVLWKAYQSQSLNATLITVAAMQISYAADYLLFEEGLFSTNTYMNHGLGYLQVCAGLTMPFLYSIQSRYLLDHPQCWHPGFILTFWILFVAGYAIFRGSNSEKDRFRREPNHPMFASYKKVPTPTGRNLLASGWWGLSRHPNYFGDLIMTFTWTLPCGLGTVIPYLYPVNLVFMLVAMAEMDNTMCQKKHGAAWERYCQEVKYKIVPYVY